jgi:hypothetical protein
MKIISKITFVSAIIALLAVPASAQIPQGVPITLQDIEGVFHSVAQFMIRIGVVIAVIVIIWAGITYMTAGADSTKVNLARQRLKTGLIGSLIVLGIGVILRSIEGVITGQFFS